MTKSPYEPSRTPAPKPKRVLRSADSSPYDVSGRAQIPPRVSPKRPKE